jgi:hypothetical protein
MHKEVLDIILKEVPIDKEFHCMPSGEIAKQAFCTDIIPIKATQPQEYMNGATPKHMVLGVQISDASGYNPRNFAPIIQSANNYKGIRDLFILPMLIPENGFGSIASCKTFDVILLTYIYKDIESIMKTLQTINQAVLDVAMFGLHEFFGMNVGCTRKLVEVDEQTAKLLEFTNEMLKG